MQLPCEAKGAPPPRPPYLADVPPSKHHVSVGGILSVTMGYVFISDQQTADAN